MNHIFGNLVKLDEVVLCQFFDMPHEKHGQVGAKFARFRVQARDQPWDGKRFQKLLIVGAQKADARRLCFEQLVQNAEGLGLHLGLLRWDVLELSDHRDAQQDTLQDPEYVLPDTLRQARICTEERAPDLLLQEA